VARWFGRSKKSETHGWPGSSGGGADADPLGTADRLRLAYGQTGDLSLLRGAVTAAEQARDRWPADDPHHASALSALCMLHRLRWERERDERQLERSLAYGRQAVDASPPGDPELGRHMSSLATSLQEAFDHRGRVADIDEAIGLYRACLDILATDHPEYAGTESNLANALLRRTRRHPDPAALDEAVRYARAALDHTPAHDPVYPVRLVNLGGALAGLAQSGQIRHLPEAQELYEQALRAFPASHPARASVRDAVTQLRSLRRMFGV
jgi:tetratricopeptide (TPR) repeat protein